MRRAVQIAAAAATLFALAACANGAGYGYSDSRYRGFDDRSYGDGNNDYYRDRGYYRDQYRDQYRRDYYRGGY